MMKHILIFLLTFLSSLVHSNCDFDDLTDDSRIDARDLIFKNPDNPGTRLALVGMKGHNDTYGGGTVDTVVGKFEKSLCDSFDNDDFKRKHPGAKIEIRKMDFKGYYTVCTPKEACGGVDIGKTLSKIPPPEFEPNEKVKTKKAFNFSVADGDNYSDGYIKARAIDEYPDFDPKKESLANFTKRKMEEAVKDAMGADSMSANVDDDFRKKLTENLDLYRSGSADKMDPKFRKMAKALDVLLEVPFKGSNNFETELIKSLAPQGKSFGRYSVASARSGDDMNLVVRKGKEIVKVVGVDARGLGSLNMTARLEEFLGYVQSGNSIESMEDVFKISNKAIDVADERMLTSMKTYTKVLEKTLIHGARRGHDLDQTLRYSHDLYEKKMGKNALLMQMRAGALDLCGSDVKCLQNRISTMHKTIKLMEKAGIDGHFGDSCLGVEFWARFHKVKAPTAIDKID